MSDPNDPDGGGPGPGGPDGGAPDEPPAPVESPEVLAARKRRQEVVQAARDFFVHLDQICRLLVVHSAENDAVKKVQKKTEKAMQVLQGVEGTDLACVFAEGHSFVNGVWVRADTRTWEATSLLTSRLEAIDARGFVFNRGFPGHAILQFADVVRDRKLEESSDPEDRKNAAWTAIEAVPAVTLLKVEEEPEDATEMGKAVRDRGLGVLRSGLDTLNAKDLASLDVSLRRRQRMLVRNFIDLAEESPEDLLALTTMRDLGAEQEVHTMMVCIYAVALGRMFDFRRPELLKLGMCALHHNIGEALMDSEVFEVERKLTEQERDVVEQHPLVGLDHLLKHYALDGETALRALVSAEHHLHHDGSNGYPFKPFLKPHPFSRIVQTVDVFAALTSRRPQRTPFPPDQAMKLLIRGAGAQFDPLMVRGFTRLVGRYPPGSLVELDTGEWGLVLGPGDGLDPLKRPRVLLISDEDLVEIETPLAIDLGERHPTRRAWLRTIARTREPELLPDLPSHYLFGDRVEVPCIKLDRADPTVKRRKRNKAPAGDAARTTPATA